MAGNDAAPLLREIEEAFADVQYPGDDHLVAPSSLASAEGQHVLESFRGRDWRSLSLQELRHHAESIFLLAPEAFRYYLPAYLSAAAAHLEEADVIPEDLIFALTPPGDEQDPVERLKATLIASLDGRQRKAVASFLRFMAGRWEGEEAEKLLALARPYEAG